MRILSALWAKEWLALSRDVHGLAVLFLMPAAFIVVMSLALSDVFKDEVRQTGFAVTAANPAFVKRLTSSLSGEGFRPAHASSAPLVLLVPDGFERALSSTGPVPALKLSVDPALPAPLVLAFKQRVVAAVIAARVSASLRRAGIKPDPKTFDPARAVTINIETSAGARRPSSVQQNVPAWLIFGMFFVVLPISSLFIVERREGTLARLVSQRVPFAMLLLGKIAPFFAVNLVQAALMLVAGKTLVPWLGGETLDLPARWGSLAAVTACTSLAAIGWGLLVAVCARTLEQATVIGGVGNILAAAIGGIMVPRFVMPEAMRRIADISPMAWALDGFHAVILRHGDAAELAAPCLKLLALAAALIAAALWVHQRRRVLSTVR